MDNWVVAVGLLGLLVLVVFGIVVVIYCKVVKYIFKRTRKNIHPKYESRAGFYRNDGGGFGAGGNGGF